MQSRNERSTGCLAGARAEAAGGVAPLAPRRVRRHDLALPSPDASPAGPTERACPCSRVCSAARSPRPQATPARRPRHRRLPRRRHRARRHRLRGRPGSSRQRPRRRRSRSRRRHGLEPDPAGPIPGISGGEPAGARRRGLGGPVDELGNADPGAGLEHAAGRAQAFGEQGSGDRGRASQDARRSREIPGLLRGGLPEVPVPLAGELLLAQRPEGDRAGDHRRPVRTGARTVDRLSGGVDDGARLPRARSAGT